MKLTMKLSGALIILSLSSMASAATIGSQGTWEATLKARDLDGNLATTEAFYDTTLDITWLADAALSKTETFGVAGIFSSGRMDWNEVTNWIDAMNTSSGGTGYLGQNSWRRPTILDDSNTSAILGHNSDTSRSELASLFYDTLGNLSNKVTGGGLTNSADFMNLQSYYYATDTEYSVNTSLAWSLAFHSGDQYRRNKSGNLYSFAVLDGDVGVVIATPIPAAIWLMISGLIGLLGLARSRKTGSESNCY